MTSPLIPDGYFLVARKIISSDIFAKPPLYLKVWLYLLSRAQHKTYKGLRRGQLWTTIPELIEACAWTIGYRKTYPTKDQIFQILEWLRSAHEAPTRATTGATPKATAITTTKATRGMLVTIGNFDFYQTASNYESNGESNDEADARATTNGAREQRQANRINKNGKNGQEEQEEQEDSLPPADAGEADKPEPKAKAKRHPKAEKPPREPDLIWDAVCAAFGIKHVAPTDQSRIGKIVRDLKAKGADPADIAVRLDRYRAEWPNAADTPEALVKHWDRFATERARPDEPDEYGWKPANPTREEQDIFLNKLWESYPELRPPPPAEVAE